MEPLDKEQQIGYLISQLNEQKEMLTRIDTLVLDRIDSRLDALEKLVESKFRTAEIVFKTLKVIFLLAVAVLTWKWGDLPSLWASLKL